MQLERVGLRCVGQQGCGGGLSTWRRMRRARRCGRRVVGASSLRGRRAGARLRSERRDGRVRRGGVARGARAVGRARDHDRVRVDRVHKVKLAAPREAHPVLLVEPRPAAAWAADARRGRELARGRRLAFGCEVHLVDGARAVVALGVRDRRPWRVAREGDPVAPMHRALRQWQQLRVLGAGDDGAEEGGVARVVPRLLLAQRAPRIRPRGGGHRAAQVGGEARAAERH